MRGNKPWNYANTPVKNHLNQLKQAELIRENKKGNFIYYELNSSVMEEIILWLQQLVGEGRKEHEERMGHENH